MNENKLVYIASPYAGDVKANAAFAKAACRYAMEQDATPVAVHLLYPAMLDDNVPAEREAGIKMGLRVLKACDELWLCGSRMSHGMKAELAAAERFGIPVCWISQQEIENSIPISRTEMHQAVSAPVMGMA